MCICQKISLLITIRFLPMLYSWEKKEMKNEMKNEMKKMKWKMNKPNTHVSGVCITITDYYFIHGAEPTGLSKFSEQKKFKLLHFSGWFSFEVLV